MLFDSNCAPLQPCPWLVLCFVLRCASPTALRVCLSSCRSLTQLAELPETHQILRQTCRDFADRELSPIAANLDKTHVYPAKQVHEHNKHTWLICWLNDWRDAPLSVLLLHQRESPQVCFHLSRCRSWGRWVWWRWKFQRSWAEPGWITWPTAWPWRRSAGAAPARGWWCLWTTWAQPVATEAYPAHANIVTLVQWPHLPCLPPQSLYIGPILKFGTEEQKRQWITPFTTGEKVGCFALSEPGTWYEYAKAPCPLTIKHHVRAPWSGSCGNSALPWEITHQRQHRPNLMFNYIHHRLVWTSQLQNTKLQPKVANNKTLAAAGPASVFHFHGELPWSLSHFINAFSA